MTTAESNRGDRVDNFTSFLPVVSDQIMVSRISILISAAIQSKSVIDYSADVVIALKLALRDPAERVLLFTLC